MVDQKETMEQVLKKLNGAIAPLRGMKVKDFSNLHAQVQAIVNPILGDAGHYGIWRLEFGGHELFVLDIPDFKEDARVKHGRKGTVETIRFEKTDPAKLLPKNTTIKRAKMFFELKAVQDSAMSNQKYIDTTEKDLKMAYDHKEQYNRSMAILEKALEASE